MSVIISMLEQLQINSSLFVMLGIFLCCFFLVTQLGVKKLSDYLVERDERIDGREHEIEHLKEEIVGDQQKVEAALRAAQLEGSKTFATYKMKAAEEQRKILARAREHAAQEMKTARENIAAQMGEEMKKIESQIPKLAKLVLEQILGGTQKSRKEINTLGSEV